MNHKHEFVSSTSEPVCAICGPDHKRPVPQSKKINNMPYGGDCCPFKETPGRFNGKWTNCIHGLRGQQRELQQELKEVEEMIYQWALKTAERIDDGTV